MRLELTQKALETSLLAAQQPFLGGGASDTHRWELQLSPACSWQGCAGVALESSSKTSQERVQGLVAV